MAAVRKTGGALAFASAALRAHPQVVRAALEQDPQAIRFACCSLKRDPAMLDFAVGLGCPVRIWGRGWSAYNLRDQ